MSFDQEWAALKASPGTTAGEGDAGLSLAGAGDANATARSGGKLRHSARPWTTASTVAADLRTSTNTGITELGKAYEGITGGTDGFASTLTAKAVHRSWDRRLKDVRDECESLVGKLEKVGKQLGEDDKAVGDLFTLHSKER